jgi:hypothetical protein
MSEEWPHVGTQEASVESDDAGSSSTNGATPEDEVGAPESSIEEATDSPAEQVVESPATADIAAEADAPEITAEADTAEIAAEATVEPDFLTELVRAMQTTAGLQRIRTSEESDRRRQEHIDAIRAREASQAERIRELADEDMKAIEAWVASETARIQLERERRATELNTDLETSLAEHHAKIDREIESVETAIASYRAEVAEYFEALDRETDPVQIAHQASRRPAFPSLETIDEGASPSDPATAAEPATSAASEPPLIGIMDPQAAPEPIESWAPPVETAPDSAEQAEPVAAATGAGESNSGSLIQTVPVHRPMSWLRRDSNGGDNGNPNS